MENATPEGHDPRAARAIFWWLRRPGHERQLTDCLGELARIDAAIASGLARALLETAAGSAAVYGLDSRARDVLRALPDDLTCSREEVTGHVVVRERSWWRAEQTRRGRIDWVFHPLGQEQSTRDFQ